MKISLNRSEVGSDGTVWYVQPGGNRQRAAIMQCPTCGDDFATYPSGSVKYCSKACFRKPCRRCGEGFCPATNRAAYCSYRCKRGVANCEGCGKEFLPTPKSAGRFCSTACFYELACPTGSIRPYGDGYMMVKVPPGTPNSKKWGTGANWMLEHRFVMQQKLGRPLEANENVHHINGDRADNRPENLELWKRSQPAGVRSADYHCPGCRCHEG